MAGVGDGGAATTPVRVELAAGGPATMAGAGRGIGTILLGAGFVSAAGKGATTGGAVGGAAGGVLAEGAAGLAAAGAAATVAVLAGGCATTG